LEVATLGTRPVLRHTSPKLLSKSSVGPVKDSLPSKSWYVARHLEAVAIEDHLTLPWCLVSCVLLVGVAGVWWHGCIVVLLSVVVFRHVATDFTISSSSSCFCIAM
jgi:hypothetical protein